MIDQSIESRPGFPIAAVVFLAIAAAFALAGAIFWNIHPVIVAVLPTAAGIALLLARDRPWVANIRADGLEIETPAFWLPYEAIEAATMPGYTTRTRSPIQLMHADGVVHLPARLNVPSDELFEYLLRRLPRPDPRDLPLALAKYCADQEARFGPERIFCYLARPHQIVVRRKATIAALIGGALTGPIWVAIGALIKDGLPWIVIGFIATVVLGAFALAFCFETTGQRVKNWRKSGLVISPIGLALIQGDMRGELRWHELRDIRYRTRPGFLDMQFGGAHHKGIDLVVEGAKITIVNLYDRPLQLIYDRLRAYWKDEDNFD